ncbi:immunoglobulin-like and fibronectin type III domain-containing protein 1 isoform X2 [Sinocyclocheilus rhinocerous]|uniref:immunoglobulin-like and fibronectin type III domain-containing protein 1 isoform X1 n=1 Tax=Sinocyclocheilus rhinocerous TaxID=307959 RepID=UPI0007B7E45D|nr:PREDICTED: immunoglobulin-like and fibronectin type III domain-containing protein 1 isoform X1 [Sinocyclocheilus rhinocerous]XP_016374571.1 PREDICTED: immunoglobulin-like and fibronectin type III domain-containing protein 1 isoform X2 [Sinocyclocheilus rhinocerous]
MPKPAEGTGVAIRKRSRVPGVMVTQYIEELPPGSTTPDFIRKPIALTIQEGKLAFFKAVVSGYPVPDVSWARNKGDISNSTKYVSRFDEKNEEYILEIPNVDSDQADTYKCFAINPFGKAVCTAALNVIEVGFKKRAPAPKSDPDEFRKMLKKTVGKRKEKQWNEGEIDPRFWEVLLSAPRKDYERICQEFGVTDFRWMLRKLNQKKKEREAEQSKYVEKIHSLKQIEVKTDGTAEFELDMKLKDPNSKILLFKDGEMLDYGDGTDEATKHNMQKFGETYLFSIRDVGSEDAGLYQVDVEEVNMFSTSLVLPDVELNTTLKDIKVIEGQDAVFECALSDPVPQITWCANDISVEHGEKYDIAVSEDKQVHKLAVKNCTKEDKGVYTAIAGLRSSQGTLDVEDDPSAHGKDDGADELARRLAEEKARLQREKDEAARRAQAEKDEAARKAQAEKDEAARKAQAERDEAARKAQAEKDEAARRAQSERDEAARRVQAEQDEVARRAKAERDEAARKAWEELDEAARRAQAERDEAACRAQAERDEAARKAKAEREAAERMAAMAAGKGSGGSSLGDGSEGDGTGKNGKGGDGTLVNGLGDGSGSHGKGDGLDLDGSGGDGSGDKKRTRVGELIPNNIIDHGVHFLNGLSDTAANVGESAELSCKLSSEDSNGLWYKDGKKLESKDGITIVKDGAHHKLIIHDCQERDAGKYKFEAEGRKSEAALNIKDPPKIDADALSKFSEPVIVKAGENASFKLPFSGKEPIKIQWFKEDEELLEGHGVRIEKSSTHSRLLLTKCQRKDTGEIKIKIKNEFATVEATSELTVVDRPTPPQGPVQIVESSLSAIEFKWRPPKDDGGCPVTNYNLERQQLGRNTWTKIGDIPGQPTYRDTNIDRGRKYCYRIRAKNLEGFSEVLTTNDIAAGTLAFPGSPAPPKIVSAFKDCINLAWLSPSSTGGGSIIGYNVEKRKKGSNFWSQANPKDDPIRDKKYAVKDVIEGVEYEFRVSAINTCGPGEPSGPSECAIARDPKKPPGKVKDFKITGSSYTSLSLSWTKPKEVKGEEDEAKGYFVEIRPTDQLEWSRSNTNAVIQTSFTAVGLKSMAMYWVRVIAVNEGGEGLPQSFDNYIIAMPPPVKPKFTDKKMKSFMVVKAGNTVRVSVSFEASPLPDITWLKNGVPVAKHVTITNFEKGSQLFIYTSELSDTGIYTVNVKNMVGQDTFTIEIRVTDDPKPPGPVELEQHVQGTVTLSWTPSPDEKRDNHLHYMVMKRDSVKQTWLTLVDCLFNNKFTVINILPGREYNFRVFAKNDIGLSEPSVSPVWGTTKKREKFTYSLPVSKTLDFQAAPKFIVPLKVHAAPPGYECYMSCAVTGNPTPHITWYHNNVSLNTNPNYYITNVCGVCSLLILRVGPKDMGEYKVVAESPLGHDECSTKLIVKE